MSLALPGSGLNPYLPPLCLCGPAPQGPHPIQVHSQFRISRPATPAAQNVLPCVCEGLIAHTGLCLNAFGSPQYTSSMSMCPLGEEWSPSLVSL